MALAFVSIFVNLGYGQTLGDVVDAGKLAWMSGEARQAGNAAGEFSQPLLLAGLQAAAAIALITAARETGSEPAGIKSGPRASPCRSTVRESPSWRSAHNGHNPLATGGCRPRPLRRDRLHPSVLVRELE